MSITASDTQSTGINTSAPISTSTTVTASEEKKESKTEIKELNLELNFKAPYMETEFDKLFETYFISNNNSINKTCFNYEACTFPTTLVATTSTCYICNRPGSDCFSIPHPLHSYIPPVWYCCNSVFCNQYGQFMPSISLEKSDIFIDTTWQNQTVDYLGTKAKIACLYLPRCFSTIIELKEYRDYMDNRNNKDNRDYKSDKDYKNIILQDKYESRIALWNFKDEKENDDMNPQFNVFIMFKEKLMSDIKKSYITVDELLKSNPNMTRLVVSSFRFQV